MKSNNISNTDKVNTIKSLSIIMFSLGRLVLKYCLCIRFCDSFYFLPYISFFGFPVFIIDILLIHIAYAVKLHISLIIEIMSHHVQHLTRANKFQEPTSNSCWERKTVLWRLLSSIDAFKILSSIKLPLLWNVNLKSNRAVVNC